MVNDGERVIDSRVLAWIWDGGLAERGYCPRSLEIAGRVLSRPCPMCGAKPGQWCVTESGVILDHIDKQHVRRRM